MMNQTLNVKKWLEITKPPSSKTWWFRVPERPKTTHETHPTSPFQLVDNFSPEVVGFQGVDTTGGSSPGSYIHGYVVKITMVDRVGWTGPLPNGRNPWFVHKGYGPTTTNWDDPPSTYLEPNWPLFFRGEVNPKHFIWIDSAKRMERSCGWRSKWTTFQPHISQMPRLCGISTYSWHKCMVNVGKYNIFHTWILWEIIWSNSEKDPPF